MIHYYSAVDGAEVTKEVYDGDTEDGCGFMITENLETGEMKAEFATFYGRGGHFKIKCSRHERYFDRSQLIKIMVFASRISN
jgi:hypothetical protein